MKKSMNSTSNSFYISTKAYTHTVHTYFLTVLTRRKKTLKNLQKKKIIVPHTLFLKSNKTIWFWFFNEKGTNKKIDQRYLKFPVVYSFFCLKNRRVDTTRNFNEYEILIDIAEKKEIVDYFFMAKISIRKERNLTKEERFHMAAHKRIQANSVDFDSSIKKDFSGRGVPLDTIKEDVNDILYHDKYMNYAMDYFLILNRHSLEKLKRSNYSSKLTRLYSYDVHYKKPLFYRAKVEIGNHDFLTWKFEILRIGAKGTIVNEKNSKEFFSKDLLALEAINEYSYFTVSRHSDSNEMIRNFLVKLVKNFDQCSEEKIKELSVYIMKPLQNSEINLLDVLEVKVEDASKVVNLDRISMKKFNKRYLVEKRRMFLSKLVAHQEEQERRSFKADLKGLRKSQLFRLTKKVVEGSKEASKKCSGIYCFQRSRFEAAMIDEKDDKNNLYLSKDSLKKVYKEEYKSIILDYVEHIKTVQRIKMATGWEEEKVESLTDGLMIKFRKFYSLYKIQKSKLFEHLRFIHFYQELSVCAICKGYYKKLNDLRISNIKYVSQFVQDPSKIVDEIKRYGAEVGPIFKVKGPMKKLFSDQFKLKIEEFDENTEIEEDFEIEESVLEPFERKIVRRIQRSRNIFKYTKDRRRVKSLPKMKKDTFYKIRRTIDQLENDKSGGKEIKDQFFRWKKKKTNLSNNDLRSKSQKTTIISASNILKKRKFEHILRLMEHRPVKRNKSRSRNRDSNSLNANSSLLKSNESHIRNSSYDIAIKDLEKRKKKLNIPDKNDLRNISLRLYLGKKNRVKMNSGNVVTKSSLQLSKLEKKLMKLTKIADKNRNGNLGMTRKKFLELIMCEYKGKRKVLEKNELNPYKSEVMNFDAGKVNPFSGKKKSVRSRQEVLDRSRLKAFFREKREYKRMKGMEESSHSLLGSSEEMDILFQEPVLRSNIKEDSDSSSKIKRATTLEISLVNRKKRSTLRKPTIFMKKREKSGSGGGGGGIFPFLDSISRHMELSSLIDDNLDSNLKRRRELRERIEFENMLLNENWQLAVSVLSKIRRERKDDEEGIPVKEEIQ